MLESFSSPYVALPVSLVLGALLAVIVFRQRTLLDYDLSIAETMPVILWAEADNQIVWHNAEYSRVLEVTGRDTIKLEDFTFSEERPLMSKPVLGKLSGERTVDGLSFQVSRVSGGPPVCYMAQSAEQLVTAENERNRFVQIMSETFSQLPIGVALFDQHRDLILFNPALSALLDLEATWLAQRPTLRAFLDQLRTKGALPEPRDFTTWREHFVSMERSAEEGVYFDDWILPNGAVYRVTGRPHPRGAVALFVEDISGPVSTETEYRSEIRRLYNAIDGMQSAIAILNTTGDLSFANQAFDTLWETDISNSVLVPDINSLSQLWKSNCEPTKIWERVENHIKNIQSREAWKGNVMTKAGIPLEIRVSPLVDGQSLIEFEERPLVKIPKRTAGSQRSTSAN